MRQKVTPARANKEKNFTLLVLALDAFDVACRLAQLLDAPNGSSRIIIIIIWPSALTSTMQLDPAACIGARHQIRNQIYSSKTRDRSDEIGQLVFVFVFVLVVGVVVVLAH